MKPLYTFLLGTAAMLSLASCELKNELTGNLMDKEDTGAIELGVSVKQPVSQTRADVSEIETDNYPVVIQSIKDGVTEVIHEYTTLAEMPASITVPVGQYTISSHTPGTLEKQMTSPYYAGNTNINVSKDIASKADIVCRMANSRIHMNYGEDFKKAFSEWNITIDDGGEMAMAFTQNELDAAPVYWAFSENAKAITVNIKAKTTTGNTVTDRRVFKKSDASENYEEEGDVFTGGDALEINMGTVESLTGEVTGITIKTNITFEDSSEPVEIPTINPEEPEEPNEPEGGEGTEGTPTVTCIGKINAEVETEGNIFDTGVNYSIAAENWPTTNVVISTPAGLKSMKVTIIGGNEGFQAIADDMNFNNMEMIGSTLGDTLGEMGVNLPMPQKNSTNYTFPVGQFYAMMNIYGPTKNGQEEEPLNYGEDYHEFRITVEDNNGSIVGPLSLKVTITE